VNLILDREVVTELIQSEFNKKRVSQELTKILDEHNRSNLFSNYYDLEDRLGGIGASEKTAKIIIEELKK
jgi:lipid-A-disaccharide synthase